MKKMQRISWFIFFALAAMTLQAQNRTIDSLKSILNLSGKPDDFKVLWGLAYELFDVDNEQALEYAKRAHEGANKVGDSVYLVKSGRIMGQLLRRLNKADEAIDILKHVLPAAKRLNIDTELPRILDALATIYGYQAKYDLALDYYLQALIMWESSRNKERINFTFNNLGFIYYKIENYEIALTYYEKSLKLRLENNYAFELDRLYLNMGLCYSYLRNYQMALELFNKAASACSPNCGNDSKIYTYFAMGLNAKNARKNYLAELYFNRSLAMAKVDNDQRYQLENLVMLSDLSMVGDNFDNAQKYLSQIELIPVIDDYPNLQMEFCRLNSNLNELQGNYKLANSYNQKYIDISQKSFDTKLRNNFMKVQAEFTEKENRKKVDTQAQMLALQQESIKNHKWLNISLAASCGLAVGFVVLLVRRVKQKQQHNQYLDLRVKERTKELERNRDELQHAHNEQNIILRKVSSDLVASLATLKGLTSSGSLEINEGREKYYREAELIEKKIGSYVTHHLLAK